jgi:hypothetical protein
VLPSAVNHTPADRTACLLSSCQAFIKLVNYTHMMPTRYNLDGDLKVRSRSRSRSRSLSLSLTPCQRIPANHTSSSPSSPHLDRVLRAADERVEGRLKVFGHVSGRGHGTRLGVVWMRSTAMCWSSRGVEGGTGAWERCDVADGPCVRVLSRRRCPRTCWRRVRSPRRRRR